MMDMVEEAAVASIAVESIAAENIMVMMIIANHDVASLDGQPGGPDDLL